jgi:biotin carboxyl carrier protein
VTHDSLLLAVKAQISGVFYRAAGPGEPAFVEVGSQVRKGQTLALLESMKLFSKIKAPADGEIAEICAEDKDAISGGQVVFRLKRS